MFFFIVQCYSSYTDHLFQLQNYPHIKIICNTHIKLNTSMNSLKTFSNAASHNNKKTMNSKQVTNKVYDTFTNF